MEAALFGGLLMGVAATNALELGIDVGSLDVTLHLGFPGSVSSLLQQAGRAGRREQPSASIYVAFDGPTDQYFFRHPEQLFGRSVEKAQVLPAHIVHSLPPHVCVQVRFGETWHVPCCRYIPCCWYRWLDGT